MPTIVDPTKNIGFGPNLSINQPATAPKGPSPPLAKENTIDPPIRPIPNASVTGNKNTMYPLLTAAAFKPWAIPARTTIHQPLNIRKANLFGDIVFKPYGFAKNDPQWVYRRRDQGASNYTENLDWLYWWRFGFMNRTII